MNRPWSCPAHWRRAAPPMAAVAVILLLWQALYASGTVARSVLPSIPEVVQALYQGLLAGRELWKDVATTLGSTLAGYAIGVVAAVAVAALLVVSRTAERLLMVHLLAVQSIPKVALAPLIFVWLGFGIAGPITLVALSCFYPMFVNAYAGLKSTDPNLVDMYRAFGAGRWRVLWAVRIPAAAGHLFVGLQITVLFALTSAVVMEFIAGSAGLGYQIQVASVTLDASTAFASLMLLAVSGVLASGGVKALHRRVVFWERTARVEDKGGA